MKLLDILSEIKIEHKQPFSIELNNRTIQIYPEDTSVKRVDWYEANEQCKELPGRGWRLPTEEELTAIYLQLYVKDKINLEPEFYWTNQADPNASNEYGVGLAKIVSFSMKLTTGRLPYIGEGNMRNNRFAKARAVRTLSTLM